MLYPQIAQILADLLLKFFQFVSSAKSVGIFDNVQISGSNCLADLVVAWVGMIGLKLFPRRGIRPLGKLMWWTMGRAKPPYRVVLKVEAKGFLNGKPTEVHARCEHEDGYELTAIPVVALLMQDERIRQQGLHLMGHLAEPDQFFKDMECMGAKVSTSIEA